MPLHNGKVYIHRAIFNHHRLLQQLSHLTNFMNYSFQLTDEQRISPIYEAIADWFDQNRLKTVEEKAYLEQLLSHSKSSPSILDLGCGSGEPVAKFLIEKGCQVTGIDTSARMIAICKERFPTMKWIQGDMKKLDLPQKFDAIIAWDSFFHLGHKAQIAMFPLFRSHLTDEGVLLFTSGSEHGEAYGVMQGHRIYHASFDSAEYRSHLENESFEVLIHTINDPACGNRTIWLAKQKAVSI